MTTSGVTETISVRAAETAIMDALIAAGKLTAAGQERAVRARDAGDEQLLPALTKLGLVSEIDLVRLVSAATGIRAIGAADFPPSPPFLDLLSANFLRQAKALPVGDDGDTLSLAMANPLDLYTVEAISLRTHRKVVPWIASLTEIDAALERLFASQASASAETVARTIEDDERHARVDVERLRDLASGAPVIRFVNLLISRAVELRASDIHIEPQDNQLAVRYRIDGALRYVEPPPPTMAAALISRLKIMARLDIAERRMPQDGRIRLAVRGNQIDMRVSTIPTLHGENVVLRILDRSGIDLEFTKLGFERDLESRYVSLLDQPNGILLVTGPTGSGKTTTLYTSLRHLHVPSKKLFTVEDPIEYQLDGVSQIEVRAGIGLSFAHILRGILRQDPDIIMIGEIRDGETAEIAIQAALTGHLVLSTLHTNSASGTVTRLLDMGVANYLLTSTINGIVAQRLVRKLCSQCREAYRPSSELLTELGLAEHIDATLYQAKGCPACHGTGYLGRTTLLEVMPMSPALRRVILGHGETHEIHAVAIAEGMRPIFEHGLDKALAGITTVEEILRVTRTS